MLRDWLLHDLWGAVMGDNSEHVPVSHGNVKEYNQIAASVEIDLPSENQCPGSQQSESRKNNRDLVPRLHRDHRSV